MRPEYQNLRSYFQEIKEQYAQAEATKQRSDLLKIAREILKQAQEQVAEVQDEIDTRIKSWAMISKARPRPSKSWIDKTAYGAAETWTTFFRAPMHNLYETDAT